MYRGGEGKGGVGTLEVTVTLAEYERIEKKNGRTDNCMGGVGDGKIEGTGEIETLVENWLMGERNSLF